MSSDSISSSSIPAASNAKFLAKKKRGKKSPNLKQRKLDIRRQQWLLQVKSRECEKGLSGGGEMHARDGMDQGTSGVVCVEVTPKYGEEDGSMHEFEVSDSCLNNPSSDSGSVGENDGGGSDDWEAVADALAAADGNKDQCDQKFESLLENKNVVQPEVVKQVISIVDVLKPKPAEVDRTYKSVVENKNVAQLNDQPEVVNQPTATVDVSKPKPENDQAGMGCDAFHSKPEPENGQAWRHSDASLSKPKPKPEFSQAWRRGDASRSQPKPKPKPEFCQAWRRIDAFPSKPKPKKHDQKQPTATMDYWKPKPENSLARRHDDAFRPKSLPHPQKMHRFPRKKNWHNRHGGTTSGCKDSVSDPTLCPICCEHMDSSDSNFLPCSCGYQLCLFCHKRISEDDGRCPGCRKKYDKNAVK